MSFQTPQLRLLDAINPDAPTAFDVPVRLFSHLGSWELLAIITLAIYLWDRKLGKILLATLILTAALVYPLKYALDMPRPYTVNPEIRSIGGANGPGSFPSGHAAFAFSYTIVLSGLGIAPRVGLLVVASAVALSRLYLGLHYPIDILGGVAIGVIAGLIVQKIFITNKA